MSLPTCPKCGSQLEVTLKFASGPRSAQTESASPSSLAELLDRINDEELAGAAAKFVQETRERFEKYGARTKMSEKQMGWLERIANGETGNDW